MKFRVRAGAESESGAESQAERFRVTASGGTRVTVTGTVTPSQAQAGPGRGQLEARLSTTVTEPGCRGRRQPEPRSAGRSDGEPRRHSLTGGRLRVRWQPGRQARRPGGHRVVRYRAADRRTSPAESDWHSLRLASSLMQCQWSDPGVLRVSAATGSLSAASELEAARLETFRLGRKPEGRRFSNLKAPGSGSETLS